MAQTIGDHGRKYNNFLIFFAGVAVGSICSMRRTFPSDIDNLSGARIESKTCDSDTPQVFNFIKELQCRPGHMDVPTLLKERGHGKVVVDIGLDNGDEFFQALASGYSVYGFEANPISVTKLRDRCEAATAFKCIYINAVNITEPLPPISNGGYLIQGGAGHTRSVMNMSLSGPGSSFVETAPGVTSPVYEEVTILPVSDVVNTDVFFFKLDVQGFEFEVLRGAKDLFHKHNIKTVLMEVYPRGLGNAGVDFLEFLNFIWDDLGLMCSSSLPGSSGGSFQLSHPNSLPKFAEYLKNISTSEIAKVSWGQFDDFYCFNRRKVWTT